MNDDKFEEIIIIHVRAEYKEWKMYDKSQATGIFTAAQSGLQSTLQYLFQNNNATGITRTTLNNAMYNNNSGINSTFFQMVNNQFATLDKNHDGTLSADEANQMMTDISNGLSRDQILQLKAQGSIDADLANKIISNFAKMDTNGDGRVTSAEIAAFGHTAAMQEKMDEYNHQRATNMSTFYGDDSASSVDSYSMLSYRYKNFNK